MLRDVSLSKDIDWKLEANVDEGEGEDVDGVDVDVMLKSVSPVMPLPLSSLPFMVMLYY